MQRIIDGHGHSNGNITATVVSFRNMEHFKENPPPNKGSTANAKDEIVALHGPNFSMSQWAVFDGRVVIHVSNWRNTGNV